VLLKNNTTRSKPSEAVQFTWTRPQGDEYVRETTAEANAGNLNDKGKADLQEKEMKIEINAVCGDHQTRNGTTGYAM
jgi:hypothetical protein